MPEGKEEFYKKVYEDLKIAGYQVFSENEIPGKGLSHNSKPDYIAVKGNNIIIGEIKSPAEPSTTSSWRQIQSSDGDTFRKTRREVAKREANGELPKVIGGHVIIICGQIPDYFEKLGKTYNLPASIKDKGNFLAGYSLPIHEKLNAEAAFKEGGHTIKAKVDVANETLTFIFSLFQS